MYPIRLQELINKNPDRFWSLQHYIDNLPKLAASLKERGFKMNTRDEVENARKWVELEQTTRLIYSRRVIRQSLKELFLHVHVQFSINP